MAYFPKTLRYVFRTWHLCILIFTLASCATYHLSTDSLVQQFSEAHPQEKTGGLFIMPYVFFPYSAKGNDLRYVKVLDKEEKEQIIEVTNHTGIRITRKDSSRQTFYFDTLLLQDSTITGNKTHFFSYHIKPIPFSDILKIELQK